MSKFQVHVSLHGCDDNTCFDLEVDEKEHDFLKKVAEISVKTSTYGCMPRLQVEKSKADCDSYHEEG